MWNSIECVGHPRDMGLAQGRAFAGSIRAACDAAQLRVRRSRAPSLRALVSGGLRGSGAGREFYRHFAHQAERLEGLARGAQLPTDSLLELHLRIREGGCQGSLLSRRAWLRARTTTSSYPEKRFLLERSLPRATHAEAGWVIRESVPAVGYRSLEVGLPWFVSGVAGVNEAGLAVVAGPILWGAPGRDGLPSSAILVQECLQRFADLGGAIDWCRKRPVEGEQSILLADLSGAVATVNLRGLERSVQEGDGELYLEAGEPADDDPQREEAEDQIAIDPESCSLRVEANGSTVDLTLARPSSSPIED